MNVSMHQLFATLLYSVVLGLFFGAVYDAVRIIRVVFGINSYSTKKRFKSFYDKGLINVFVLKKAAIFKTIFVFVTDIVYMTFISVSFVIFLFHFNFGIFRWFFLVFAALGILVYYHSVGKLVIAFSEVISETMKLVVNTLIFILFIPIKYLIKLFIFLFSKTLGRISHKLKCAIDIRKKKRYTNKCIEDLKNAVKIKV